MHFCSIKKKYIKFSLWNLYINKILCIFALSLKQRDIKKKTKMQLVAKLTQLKLLSKMYEHTFKNAGNQMSRQKMDELLDAKLETDKQIALLEKVLKELEK